FSTALRSFSPFKVKQSDKPTISSDSNNLFFQHTSNIINLIHQPISQTIKINYSNFIIIIKHTNITKTTFKINTKKPKINQLDPQVSGYSSVAITIIYPNTTTIP
ncbi:hypothetical protein CH426_26040, partial [Klebsiella aerogenes]